MFVMLLISTVRETSLYSAPGYIQKRYVLFLASELNLQDIAFFSEIANNRCAVRYKSNPEVLLPKVTLQNYLTSNISLICKRTSKIFGNCNQIFMFSEKFNLLSTF
ncbi:hypothetical protein B8W87_06345 [Rothia dentocariosa]|uniref:Uncharacterized protein n=1 Tax=Rothia dentocariosa TaxID=2047 RepID=A0AAE5NIK8_9MICC|nr:hypothetical protein B8W87_06345 [Rothia dentocariosa]